MRIGMKSISLAADLAMSAKRALLSDGQTLHDLQ
jgi:hypothetical protein